MSGRARGGNTGRNGSAHVAADYNDLGADEVFDTHTVPEFPLFALNGPFRWCTLARHEKANCHPCLVQRKGTRPDRCLATAKGLLFPPCGDAGNGHPHDGGDGPTRSFCRRTGEVASADPQRLEQPRLAEHDAGDQEDVHRLRPLRDGGRNGKSGGPERSHSGPLRRARE